MSRLRDFYRRRLEWVPGAHVVHPLRRGAIGLVIALAAMTMAYTHKVPFLGGGARYVRAEFTAPAALSQRTKVRVGGVDVGRVDHLESARSGRASVVVMRITADHLELHRDASAYTRPRTVLSGSFEVELNPGSPSAPQLGDRTIPLSRTGTQPDWDDFNQPYSSETRSHQRKVFKGLRETFAAPDAIGQTLHTLGPALSVIGRGTEALRGRETGELRQVVATTGRTVDALSRERGALEGLVRGADRTLAATAGRRRDLGEMVELSPAALDSTTLTMGRLETTLDHLDPLVHQLRPGARKLAGATRSLRPGLDETVRLLRASVPLLRPTGPALRDLASMGAQGVPLMRGLRPTLDRLDRQLLPFLRRRDPDTGLLNYESIGPFFGSLGSAAGEFDAEDYILHFATNLGADSALIPCGPDLNLQQHGRCRQLNDVVRVLFGGRRR